MAEKKKRIKHDYIDNKKFFAAMKEFYDETQQAIAEGKEDHELPAATNYIGDCFVKIATHLGYRGNFIGYTYRGDMVADGIEDCLLRMRNFNPEKSNNPFAYFTQIIWFAFLRRIEKEKKQQYIKYKATLSGLDEGTLAHINANDENAAMINITPVAYEQMLQFIGDYEAAAEQKKKQQKAAAEKKAADKTGGLLDIIK